MFFAKYLSLHRDIQPFAEYAVTPCMGVWIETRHKCTFRRHTWVTPCMGVWIETNYGYNSYKDVESHTLYGCVDWNILLALNRDTPRGHTLYGCVDWNPSASEVFSSRNVTPCMGVWIETTNTNGLLLAAVSHTLYGCVDWNHRAPCALICLRCHTLYGCVDWNFIWLRRMAAASCHTLYGCVDWNARFLVTEAEELSHTLYGCVDWNALCVILCALLRQSHPVWVCGLKPQNVWRLLLFIVVTPCMGVWIETFWYRLVNESL